VKYAFIGLGHATTWLHLPAARKLPQVTVVGGADPSAERRAAWAKLGAGPAVADAHELIEGTRPDVVVVATPPDSHADLCLAALRAGAHVLCEKPFVETVAQADAVIHAADEAGRFVGVNHEFRYMPIFSALPPLVGSASYGRPVFLQFVQLMDLAPWNEKVAWRAAMPNRTLFEGGVHIVDLAHMVMGGRMPERVFATTSSGLDPERNADAIHLVTLDYGGGVLGQITIDRLCPSGTRYLDLRLDCEKASIRASYGGRAFVQVGVKRGERPGVRVDFGPEGLSWAERGLRRSVIARNRRRATVHATERLHAEFLQAVSAGKEPPTTARIARETLSVIEAAYRSAAAGVPVSVSGEAAASANGSSRRKASTTRSRSRAAGSRRP
jgi:predicted dehydrogenase